MYIFNKLIQKKRQKMLILSCLLLFLICVKNSSTFNLTYIIKENGKELHPSCIAEENERYAGIGWIYPIPESENLIPQIVTKYIPIIKNDYNCKFSKNDFCNKIWILKNWQIDEKSSRTYEYIDDSRWEDCPVIFTSNSTKEFKDRIEITKLFNVGLSVRSSGNVEIIVCEGWNPSNYPCYHILIGQMQVFLKKFPTLPKNISNEEKSLDTYEAFSNILSDDEWRNLAISLNESGTLELRDVNLNRTIVQFTDADQLKPLYLFVRSETASLWKIHQNQFLYTSSTQISRLGPTLSISSKDLCISLFVKTCEYCEMSFFILRDGQRKVLKSIEPITKWTPIKIKEENTLDDKLIIFVETKMKNSNNSTGFWAIDDVRVCNENEVKVTHLKVNGKEDIEIHDYVSCQLISNPKWRPRKLTFRGIKDFPTIEASSDESSIKLNWTLEDPNNELNYFVTYQANDICTLEPYNLRRTKSNGFLVTKHNQILLKSLVPYTHYNISVSTVLHESDKEIFYSTLETDMVTPEELPDKVKILTTDTEVFISWERIGCQSTYGHIIYSIKLTNEKLNFSKELDNQTNNTYEIRGLEPFTLYSLRIITSRNSSNIKNGKNIYAMDFNFTTLAGVAPPVENLELYSIDTESASLRYDLPKKLNGIPAQVQVSKCNALSFKKCKSQFFPILQCKFWPLKYCIDVNYLMPHQMYTFRVTIKNKLTHSFGNETHVDGYTIDRVPGSPTNITYRIVDCQNTTDYCHLNISWLHPYNQNGTITSFNIILNSTETESSTEKSQLIHEVYKVDNKTYLPQYIYQIKYIPYGRKYNLYIQSSNAKYKSNLATTPLKTADIGDHIDQSPNTLEIRDTSVVFKIAHLDRRLSAYTLTVIAQDFEKTAKIDRKLLANKKIADNLCHSFGNTWISFVKKIINNETNSITIGDDSNGQTENVVTNKKLKPNTQYCFTFIITNSYKTTEHDVVYYEKLRTLNSTTEIANETTASQYNHLYVLLVLLLLVPLGFLVYRYVSRRRRRPRTSETKENEYETLPFDDNCVVNETYDKLLHK